ncbi:MAG: GntR family transcriptional regulator [Clostridiales bacterium]|nr:GntR family transcriptional regulator [Clostridiales bacterium]
MFAIDKLSRTPIYEQLIDQFELCILSGDIGPEGQLPSVRYLSQTLSVNPNTLQRAYAEIERRGLCYTVPGNGRYIAKDALIKLREAAESKTSEFEELVSELKGKGVKMETLVGIVNRVYSGEGKVIAE